MNDRDEFELKRALDGLPREIAPPEVWPEIRARLKANTEDRRPKTVVGIRSPVSGIRIAALLTLLAISAGALVITRQRAGTWRLAGADREFQVGEQLATSNSGAALTVGTIGTVTLDTATRVRLLAARATEHRLALEHGTIHAEISAPPRLFMVETPSGTAVDLGCAYTLVVDSTGTSTIVVTAGWVAFEDGGRRSLIPAGWRAVAHKGGGLGTPVRDGATDSLKAAVAAFDAAPGDATLDVILAQARSRDAVTLWHLVQRTEGAQRDRVAHRLTSLAPLPAELSPVLITRAEPRAMEIYWATLPGTLPIVPAWRRWLWETWLALGG